MTSGTIIFILIVLLISLLTLITIVQRKQIARLITLVQHCQVIISRQEELISSLTIQSVNQTESNSQTVNEK